LPAIDRLGIGELRVTDGPNGARRRVADRRRKSAAFPVGIAIGASWYVAFAQKVGAALAQETNWPWASFKDFKARVFRNNQALRRQ
jgi:beta-glucosidase